MTGYVSCEDFEGHADDRMTTDDACLTRLVELCISDKKEYLGPPVWKLLVGLVTFPLKNPITHIPQSMSNQNRL